MKSKIVIENLILSEVNSYPLRIKFGTCWIAAAIPICIRSVSTVAYFPINLKNSSILLLCDPFVEKSMLSEGISGLWIFLSQLVRHALSLLPTRYLICCFGRRKDRSGIVGSGLFASLYETPSLAVRIMLLGKSLGRFSYVDGRTMTLSYSLDALRQIFSPWLKYLHHHHSWRLY